MRFRRRQLLRALGLGLPGLGLAPMRGRAQPALAPARVVFFVQPHGHVPTSWRMTVPGATEDAVAERSLVELKPGDFSEALRPLHPLRRRLLAVEGLSHTSVLFDIAEVMRAGIGGDANNHAVAVAGLLTGARAAQIPGFPCTGGAVSIDQELARRTAAAGRFGSRVYGSEYVPNLTVAPFSFLGPSHASPLVATPAQAFMDLLGHGPMPGAPGEVLRPFRTSVLDAVAREYEAIAPRMATAARRKLDEHRALVRELELGLAGQRSGRCEERVEATGSTSAQFMEIVRVALACDLTRVITYVAPVPQPAELGYPADTTIHASYAHASVKDATSCGLAYSPVAERAMTDLSVWYAGHFAKLLGQLDAVPEGDGSLLDHTVVVWLSELGTPAHQHHDAPVLLAGGCNDFFATGRYVRYPRTLSNPLPGQPRTGPAHNRLFVSLLRAMGGNDESFGLAEARGADGTSISLRGPLRELHRSG